MALKLVPTGTDREAREILEAERWGAKLQEQFCRVSRTCAGGLRARHRWRIFLHRDGVPRGAKPLRGHRRRAAGAGARGRHRHPAVPVSRSRARLRSHDRRPAASVAAARRSQAAQHPRARRRPHQGPRFRHRQGAVAQPESHAQRLRQHRLSVARAARVRRDRCARGFLGGRRPALRNGGRRPAVPGAGHAPAGAAHPIACARRRRSSRRVRPVCRRSSPSCSPGMRRIATATPPPFAPISSASSAGATTQAEREGWPARAHDEPATRRTHPPARSKRKRPAGRSERRRACNPPCFRRRRRSLRRVQPQPAKPRRRFLAATSADGAAAAGARHRRQRVSVASRREARSRPACRRWNSTASAELWDQYDALNARGSLRIGVVGLERALTNQTATLADRVIGNYRTPLSRRSGKRSGGRRARRWRAR